MFKRIGTYVKGQLPVGIRVGKELALPLIGSAAWVIAIWKKDRSILDNMASGGFVFFLIFYMQGQLSRMSKNVHDQQHDDAVMENFRTLHDAVAALQHQNLAAATPLPPSRPEEPPPVVPQSPPKPDLIDLDSLHGDVLQSRKFFEEANRALQEGLHYPAVLSAAVGFEHALRNAGEKYLDIPRRKSLLFTLNALRRPNEEIAQELQTLLRVRNGLVHGDTYNEDIDEFEAGEVIRAFLRGVRNIEMAATGVNPDFRRRYPKKSSGSEISP